MNCSLSHLMMGEGIGRLGEGEGEQLAVGSSIATWHMLKLMQ